MATTNITITGNTYPARDLLKSEGFAWDAASKSWTYTDWPGATESAVRAELARKGKRFGVYDVGGLVIEVG